MITYQDVQPPAVAIKEAVRSRRMPPSGAVKRFGDFRNDQGLTQEQIELVSDCVEGGMLKGNNPRVRPEPPTFKDEPAVAAPSGVVVRGPATLTHETIVDGILPDHVPDAKPMQIVAALPDAPHRAARMAVRISQRLPSPVSLSAATDAARRHRHPRRTFICSDSPSSRHTMIRASFRPFLITSIALLFAACSGGTSTTPPLKEIQRTTSGAIRVVLMSGADALKQGKDQAYLEFRTGSDAHLVDVGTVKVNATMAMAGMAPMIGSTTVARTDTAGRYAVTTDLGMAGSWRIGVEWDGPQGHGSATLQGTVR